MESDGKDKLGRIGWFKIYGGRWGWKYPQARGRDSMRSWGSYWNWSRRWGSRMRWDIIWAGWLRFVHHFCYSVKSDIWILQIPWGRHSGSGELVTPPYHRPKPCWTKIITASPTSNPASLRFSPGHAVRTSQGQDHLVGPAIVCKTSVGRWAQTLRRLMVDGVLFVCIANYPCSIARKFLFYPRSQRREASGLKRTEVELEEEQWREQRDEFDRKYWMGEFFRSWWNDILRSWLVLSRCIYRTAALKPFMALVRKSYRNVICAPSISERPDVGMEPSSSTASLWFPHPPLDFIQCQWCRVSPRLLPSSPLPPSFRLVQHQRIVSSSSRWINSSWMVQYIQSPRSLDIPTYLDSHFSLLHFWTPFPPIRRNLHRN